MQKTEQQRLLMEVFSYFNEDKTTVPKDLYEKVFEVLRETECMAKPNDQLKAEPKQPFPPEGILSSHGRSIIEFQKETDVLLDKIRNKLNGIGYFEQDPKKGEEISELGDNIYKQLEGGTNVFAANVSTAMFFANMQNKKLEQLLRHIEFLF